MVRAHRGIASKLPNGRRLFRLRFDPAKGLSHPTFMPQIADCLACTALYRNGGGSNSQRNLLKPKIVISHLGGSDHRSEGRNEETRNGRGCGRKTSSSATVSCIFGFPRMSHWKRGRRCVAAERIPGVRGVTEHDVIEFQPRRPSPRVRNGREAPRLQTFQASPRAGRFDRQESSAATRQLISTCPANGYPAIERIKSSGDPYLRRPHGAEGLPRTGSAEGLSGGY